MCIPAWACNSIKYGWVFHTQAKSSIRLVLAAHSLACHAWSLLDTVQSRQVSQHANIHTLNTQAMKQNLTTFCFCEHAAWLVYTTASTHTCSGSHHCVHLGASSLVPRHSPLVAGLNCVKILLNVHTPLDMWNNIWHIYIIIWKNLQFDSLVWNSTPKLLYNWNLFSVLCTS